MIIDIFDMIRIVLLSIGVFAFGYLFYRPKIVKILNILLLVICSVAIGLGYTTTAVAFFMIYMAGYIAADIFDKEAKILARKKKR